MYSSIKIGGFALGICCCFLIALFIRDELNYDTHYPDVDRIFRIYASFTNEGTTESEVLLAGAFCRCHQGRLSGN